MRTATITGTAVDSRGQPLQTVILAQEIRGEAFGLFGAAARASVGSDGRFTLPHVAAGEYKLEGTTLSASGNAVEPPEVAIMPITVNGEDVAGVSLVGSTGGFVSGRLVSDSGSLPNPRDIRIRIGPWFAPRYIGQSEPLKLGTFGGRGGVDYADVREDGTFVLNHAFGPARVQVTLPDGWTVKAIRHDEADLTDAELNFTNGQRLTDISIVMTQRITTLTGQVKDEHNMPTTSGTVVVFSTNQEKLFEQSRHIRAARPDQHGGYKIQGLPAGEYFVAAVDDVDEGDWWDPEFLNRIRPSAIRVMLAESGNVVQTLTLSGR
jgi:hypothetical protein